MACFCFLSCNRATACPSPARQADLSSIQATGTISIVTRTNIDLNGAACGSDDGDITFSGPADLTVDVSIDSDKDEDDTDGWIRFASTLNGAHKLTLNADTGNINFDSDFGSTYKLTSITIK